MSTVTRDGPTCGHCGHWSESSESGLVRGTGYCGRLEKLTDRGSGCDAFVTRTEYERAQRKMAERLGAHLDD